MIKRDFLLDMQSGLHIWNSIIVSPSHQQAKEKYVIPSIDSINRWYHSNGRKWRGTKQHLDEGERGEWKKIDLKFNIPKTKIMASGPITSWKKDGEKVETWQFWFSWAPKSGGWWLQPFNLMMHVSWKKSYDKPRKFI